MLQLSSIKRLSSLKTSLQSSSIIRLSSEPAAPVSSLNRLSLRSPFRNRPSSLHQPHAAPVLDAKTDCIAHPFAHDPLSISRSPVAYRHCKVTPLLSRLRGGANFRLVLTHWCRMIACAIRACHIVSLFVPSHWCRMITVAIRACHTVTTSPTLPSHVRMSVVPRAQARRPTCCHRRTHSPNCVSNSWSCRARRVRRLNAARSKRTIHYATLYCRYHGSSRSPMPPADTNSPHLPNDFRPPCNDTIDTLPPTTAALPTCQRRTLTSSNRHRLNCTTAAHRRKLVHVAYRLVASRLPRRSTRHYYVVSSRCFRSHHSRASALDPTTPPMVYRDDPL